jgi:hypothetical protein
VSPERPKVFSLPPEVREELERRLVGSNFTGYVALAEWMESLGFVISKSGIHRFGQGIERKLEAIKASTEAAKLIADAAPDEEGARSAAVIALVQSGLFEAMVSLEEANGAEPADRVKLLSRAASAIADVSRADVGLKRYAAGLREKMAAKFKALEAETQGPKPSLDPATFRRVVEAAYGIL